MGLLHFDYLSQVLGYHTNLYFILPACTHKGEAPAATLYLLHGGSGNGMDWIRYTSIERYADKYNIAVVLPEVDGSCFYADMKHGYKYFTYLTDEVVAVAEGLLPVNKEPEKRPVPLSGRLTVRISSRQRQTYPVFPSSWTSSRKAWEPRTQKISAVR